MSPALDALPGRDRRHSYLPWLQLVVLVGVAIAVLVVVDTGKALRVIRQANVPLVLAGGLTIVAGVLARVHRWRLAAVAFGLPHRSFKYYLRMFYTGMFVGAVVPAPVSIFTPAYFMSQDGESGKRAAASILLDRLVETVLLALLLVPAVLYTTPGLVTVQPVVAFALVAVLLLSVIVLAARPFLRERIVESLRNALARPLLRTSLSLDGFSKTMLRLSTWSLVIVGSQVLAAFWIARALGMDVPLVTLAAVYLIVLAATTLPISVLGFGPREGLLVLLLRPAGVVEEEALALGLILSLLIMVVRIPGILAWMMSSRRNDAVPAKANAAE